MELLLITADPHPDSVLPALGMLPHVVRTAAPQLAAVRDAGRCDAVPVDARTELLAARNLCGLLGRVGRDVPVVAVLSQGGRVAVSGEWVVDGILLSWACPAEVDTRLRLLRARSVRDSSRSEALVMGELVIDEAACSLRLRAMAGAAGRRI